MGCYFNTQVNLSAVTYLQLAATLVQQVCPGAFSIAEDLSGMPGLCRPVDEGGFGFTHRLYDATRGYNHLALDNGDNDLYVQSIANAQRTAVVLSPHSVVVEERSSRWSEWLEYMRYNNSTRVHYPLKARMNGNRERGSRILFFLTSICSLVVLPSELRIAVALLVLLRYAIVVWSTRRTARKLGEKRIAKLYWLYDIVGPVLEVMTRARIDNSSKVWR